MCKANYKSGSVYDRGRFAAVVLRSIVDRMEAGASLVEAFNEEADLLDPLKPKVAREYWLDDHWLARESEEIAAGVSAPDFKPIHVREVL